MRLLSVLVLFIGNLAAAQEYYLGQETMKSPDGSLVFMTYTKLVHRIYDEENSKIEEEVVYKDPQGTYVVDQVLLDVSGHEFEVSTPNFSGSGRLFGQAWAWTGGQAEFLLEGGGKILSLDFYTEDQLNSVYELWNAGGELEAVSTSSLVSISMDDYDALKSMLLRTNSNSRDN